MALEIAQELEGMTNHSATARTAHVLEAQAENIRTLDLRDALQPSRPLPAVLAALMPAPLKSYESLSRYRHEDIASMSTSGTTGLTAVAGGISEALVTTALGLFVAIPAVWAYNYFSGKIEAFDIEMDNSGSELVDYFLKQSSRAGSRK